MATQIRINTSTLYIGRVAQMPPWALVGEVVSHCGLRANRALPMKPFRLHCEMFAQQFPALSSSKWRIRHCELDWTVFPPASGCALSAPQHLDSIQPHTPTDNADSYASRADGRLIGATVKAVVNAGRTGNSSRGHSPPKRICHFSVGKCVTSGSRTQK